MKLYVILELAPGDDIYYHVFDNEELFKFSKREIQSLSEPLLDEAVRNEEEKCKKRSQKSNKVITNQITKNDIRNTQFYSGEIYPVGSIETFLDLEQYTYYMIGKANELEDVEFFEGISC